MTDLLPALQKFHRLQGSAVGASAEATSDFLEHTPLSRVFDAVEHFAVNGPSDAAALASDVLEGLMCDNHVLETADLSVLQERQISTLQSGTPPKLAVAVLRHLKALFAATSVPFVHKFAYLLGQGPVLLEATLNCLARDDLEAYEAATEALKAAAACEPSAVEAAGAAGAATTDEAVQQNIMLFTAFFSLVGAVAGVRFSAIRLAVRGQFCGTLCVFVLAVNCFP
jgi:hypothetical protein